MPVASIILGIVALLFMVGGFLMTGVPVAGAVLSFGAPLSALVGIVLAGVAMSRAKREGGESGAAVAGLVVNIIAFILGLAVALTCGLCNVCFSASTVGAGAAAANNPFLQPGQGGLNDPNGANGPQGFGQLGQQLAAEMSRLSLTMSLASAQLGCASDPTGAQAAQAVLHPSVATQYQGMLCNIPQNTLDAFGRGCDEGAPCSTVTVLASTPDAAKATALGLDANQCFLYQSGQARIIGCNTPSDYRVILMENLAAVQ
ncbi:MAG: hypothetical protein H6722_05195 [Sandaracinus sp.]|nr:hypothetical protein [Sandaracinus sp.]